MIPFPLPPALARLHELLEAYTERHEEGFFMAEQDRNKSHQAQPVLVFVTASSLRQDPDSAPRRQAPDWIGEILAAGPASKRMPRYAKAGVKEYWRVDLGLSADGVAPPRIEVHWEPRGDGTYAKVKSFEAGEKVVSHLFSDLDLRPGDLV